MQKLVIAGVAAIMFFGIGSLITLKTYNPQPIKVNVVKTTKIVKTVATIYHVGDTQNGITLIGVYPYSYQNMMAGNGDTPPTVHLLYFAVSGVSELAGSTQVLNTDGVYLTPDGPLTTIPACGVNSCISFLEQGTLSTFYYKDLKWTL